MENIVRKGKTACYKQFLLFSQCFLPYTALIFHFKCTLKCRLQSVSIWTSLKFCRLVMGLIFSARILQILLFSTKCKALSSRSIVASHERRHYFFTRFCKAPKEAAMLFAIWTDSMFCFNTVT